MIKTVIFDLDGTIFDSEQLVRQGWQYAAQKLQLGDVDALFLQCVGTNQGYTENVLQRRFGAKFSYAEFRKYTRAYFHQYTDVYGIPLKKGARELLTYLREQEYTIGIASSSTLQYILNGLRQTALLDYFQVIVSGENLQHGKPEPDIYLMACDKLGVSPAKAYAIEDSYNGIRAASRAGMLPIMVPDLLPATVEMWQLGAKVFADLLEVKQYFQVENLAEKIFD